MISGKPVPSASSSAHDGPVLEHTAPDELTASQPIRHIEEIIAKLKLVTKQLEYPAREDDGPQMAEAQTAEAQTAEATADMS